MSDTYKHIRKTWKLINFPTILTLFALCVVLTAVANAQMPDFPESMPIVERPFPDDPDKFSFAIIGD